MNRKGNPLGAGSHWKGRIYDAIQEQIGIARGEIHRLVYREKAPSISAECFILWYHARVVRLRALPKEESNRRREARRKKRVAGWSQEKRDAKRAKARAVYAATLETRRPEARAKARRRRATPEGKITAALRRRLYDLARDFRAPKRKSRRDSTLKIVGCTVEFLREYLEQRFRDGMTWENYGTRWHIDHRRPCASFDLMKESERAACFHFTNLQPLWAFENLIKGDRWA